MEFRPQDMTVLSDYIRDSHNILIISHRRPDADAIGANIALRLVLEHLGKRVVSACIDPVGEEYYFLPKVYVFVEDFGKPEDYDLIITVDCGDSKITEYHRSFPHIWHSGVPVVNIDHHMTNNNFGDVNIVRTDAASTTQILYFLFEYFHWHITCDMADLMMAGLSFDTGHFRHDNTSPEVLEVAAHLMRRGARIDFIAKHMYRLIPVSTLKVWGNALSRIRMNEKNVVSTVITQDDIQSHQADENELKSGELITYINGVPDSLFSLLISEKNDVVKGSLRTQHDHIDVSKIAKDLFNGGGHKKAAGFAVPGKIHIDELGNTLVKKIEESESKAEA